MHLSQGETIAFVIKRHKTPLVFRLFFIFLAAVPVFFFFTALGRGISQSFLIGITIVASLFLFIVIGLLLMNYVFDKIIVTNRRVILEDWHSPISRVQHEAKFSEIQDIRTRETGILARFPILNYGNLIIETAASKTCVEFDQCPDPDGTKHRIAAEIVKSERQHSKLDSQPSPARVIMSA